MAHRRHHHHLSEDSAIFSPSVARIAASTARDWSYVDSWLGTKFRPHCVPPFERNPDTLKALLALAALNEAADEERHLLAKSESAALQELSLEPAQSLPADTQSHNAGTRRPLRQGFLDAVQHNLPAEGHTALDAMANMALQLGADFPEPESLGRRMVSLQASIQETEQMRARVDILHRHIEEETSRINNLRQQLQGDDYKPPAHLAKQNLELQRKVKAMSAKLPDLQDRVAALASSAESSHPTTNDIARDEQEYLDILARKRDLDLQMAAFHGLPSNPDMARSELEALRGQLRNITSQRDQVFEGLVERESPVKRRM
ncbi:hypothetical protein QQZ08_004757 [Neonectria magnoliae]|uniref:Uncharacterized protein n=1 Tax=Neonectria magnoliae TaxID=2732573 RepID=A0ABR1I550_9HYPO